MSKKDKLISRLKSKPRDMTFDELETLMKSLGFSLSNKGKTSGSKIDFVRGNVKISLHKPHGNKCLHLYQILDVLNKLSEEIGDSR